MRIAVSHHEGASYHVAVDAPDGTSSSHLVTVWPSDVERYAPGSTPEELLEASFAFLLQHEPKEAILPRFDLPIIERYFPDYPVVIRSLIADLGDFE